jgi:hypothetical protein
MNTRLRLTARRPLAVGTAAIAVVLLAACSGSTSAADDTSDGGTATAGSSAVLPVDTNPIKNDSDTQALTIDEVLVENNEDDQGNAVDDHLEIALTNTGSDELDGFEIYYTISDPTTGDTESYYAALPADFTIAPGDQRVVHFDNTGQPDHFAVNQYSLYYTDTNALEVTVEVSARDSAIATSTVQKDAGGEEEAD